MGIRRSSEGWENNVVFSGPQNRREAKGAGGPWGSIAEEAPPKACQCNGRSGDQQGRQCGVISNSHVLTVN